jgi:RNA polymerase sigma-70 factor (ECF subfamily)
MPEPRVTDKSAPWFASTQWGTVLSARDTDDPAAHDALERLCQTYWPPLYAYARHHGHAPHDAEDLTQAFFHRLLDRHFLAQVDPLKGRFRSFLVVAMNHFLANEWDHAHAVKRGGRVTFLPLDATAMEERYSAETTSNSSPEKDFDRRWALTVIERVLARLRDECNANGQSRRFDALKDFLTGEDRMMSYAELAAQLETTEAALKMAVQRMRHRCGQLLREEVAQTVARHEDVEEEVRCLFAALR